MTDMVTAPTPESWIFTFGSGQKHDGKYVVIPGTYSEARAEMLRHFGNAWSFQYAAVDRPALDEVGMVELLRLEWPTPAEDAITEALRGPWLAVLADRTGAVYPTYAEAAKVLFDDTEMTIQVVRDSAEPVDDEDAEGMRLPQQYFAGDLIFEIDAFLVDEEDPALGAKARYAQAQAMADGLNAAGGTR
ncbi:hypothetical protein [Micromonospora sp. NPDC023814]|uniref:hypothetical protein n=1 Tax=Micromonospora sp. NPDC023814 TaxID=3154596 RepID=UPI0033C86A36